jgi:NAD(P)-dependent dehydrogenase (short-subunit alcohol dehydrogenase family)
MAPRPGLVPYAASKGALEALVRGLRTEHPLTRFTCYSVGPTFPTEFADEFDLTVFGGVVEHWNRLGMATDGPSMNTDSVAEVVLSSLHLLLDNPTVSMDQVLLQPAAIGKAAH